MPRESREMKRKRAAHILRQLHTTMPEVSIELNFSSDLELLVAVILSAQCTDARVNTVTPALFRAFPNAEAYARATPEKVEAYLRTLGLFRAKAKHLVALGEALQRDHGGAIPRERAILERLPGVGRKTAGVVSMYLNGDPAFPVDTHVFRLAHRLGLSQGTTPDAVEADLQALIPTKDWLTGHQLRVWHGRKTCTARSPQCQRCQVVSLCPQIRT